jgi:peptidoglycan/xylan/chitin deacetylase (PgdA/CDA1 family)
MRRRIDRRYWLPCLVGVVLASWVVPGIPAAGATSSTVVSLTFDDEAISQYTLAYQQALQPHGGHATFFVSSETVGAAASFMSWPQLKTLAAAGNDIGGKAYGYKLTNNGAAQAQVCDDRYYLIQQGLTPAAFAYPGGAYDASVEDIVKSCGYGNGRTAGGLSATGPTYAQTIPPANLFATRAYAPAAVTLANMESLVTGAASHGGGWDQIVIRRVCSQALDPGAYSGCIASSGHIELADLNAFLDWMANAGQPGGAPAGTSLATVRSVLTSMDATAPTTTIACNGAPCTSTHYTDPVSVTFPAMDTGSSLASTHYTTDGSDPTLASPTYTGVGPQAFTFKLELNDTTTVKFRSWDNAGNAESVKTQVVQIGAAPSYTTLVDGRASRLAHWRLGEASGTTAWDTTGAYNGTYAGNPTLGVPGAIAGDTDTAVGFNGSTSKMSIPLLPAVGDFSVEGWSYLTSPASTNNTVFGGSGTVRLLARPGSPNSATAAYAGVWLNGTEYALQPSSTASNLNTWVHWVLTRQGSTLTLYRNGVQIGQRTDLPATALANLNGAIGMQSNGSYPLTGRIDEVALYRSALSATDVSNDYQAAQGGSSANPSYKSVVLGESSLVSYLRLDESTGTTATDSKGTNNGTYSAVSLGSPGAITHDPDTSASFNGSTSSVSVPSLGAAGDFTIEGWTYLTNSSITNNTVYGSTGAVRLFARPGSPTTPTMGYVGVWLNGTEYRLQPNSTASNINSWVYWAVTRQGSTLTLYRNGVQIGQRTDLPATATATISGSIGAQGGSAYYLAGRIDDVAIYDSALSASAITSHYNAAMNGPAPS